MKEKKLKTETNQVENQKKKLRLLNNQMLKREIK